MFRGIPYAAPPVGELRFQPPQPHSGWTEVREASAMGPANARMVSRIQKAWGSFAWEGKPALEPAWQATTSAAPSIALLGEPSSVVTQLPGNRCAKLHSMGLVR